MDRINTLIVVGVMSALSLGLASVALAQQSDDRDCSDFSSQSEAQQFFEQNGGPQSDPHMLDTDGDGVACEGLAGSASPSPGTSSPTPTPSGQALPDNGIYSAVIALSGVTFLEAGLGLSLLARRMRSRRRLPLFLLKTLASAAREGRTEVALSDDVYVVRRTEEPEEISDDSLMDEEDFYEPLAYAASDDESIIEPEQKTPPAPLGAGGVYAAVAGGLSNLSAKPPSEEAPADERREPDDDWPYFTPPGV